MKKDILKKRKELANTIAQISDMSNKPYFSIDWIKKYILCEQDSERIKNIKKILNGLSNKAN